MIKMSRMEMFAIGSIILLAIIVYLGIDYPWIWSIIQKGFAS